MTKRSVEALVEALNACGVRYMIAGGLAVVAHGHVRFTADVDLILDFSAPNLARAIDALRSLGYQPRVPVPFEEFADADTRARWSREKNMKVFCLYSDAHAATEVDLFVEPPLDFETAYASAARMEVAPGVYAVFVGYRDLLRLKTHAGRPTDLDDIRRLEAVHEDPSE
ncbi:MAG: hypothetical protein ABL982_10250 [Vicinamibacterales bacterium]